jgi:hypothetical protein
LFSGVLLVKRLLEYAQQMAAHESARTTKFYDRRNDQVTARSGGEDRPLTKETRNN